MDAQVLIKENVSVYEYSINNTNFELVIDSLINVVEQCNWFNKSYCWSIEIEEINDSIRLYITMSSNKDLVIYNIRDTKQVGYFYKDEYLFIVVGDKSEIICNNTLNKKEFNAVLNSKFIEIEDLSIWVFLYEEKRISLYDKFIIPCNYNK